MEKDHELATNNVRFLTSEAKRGIEEVDEKNVGKILDPPLTRICIKHYIFYMQGSWYIM